MGWLKFDLLAVNDLMTPFFAAGLGSFSMLPDPDSYNKGFFHCDFLIVGDGAAGLTAARSGAQVIFADEDWRLGGRLLAC